MAEHKKIDELVERAREYLKKGYSDAEAIKMANDDVMREEMEMYEK